MIVQEQIGTGGDIMKRQEKFSYIEERLCHWCNYIAYCGCNNFTDINKVSEDFVKNLVNIVYDINCINLNRTKAKFPGIDLGDKSVGIGIQVTSNCDSRKIIDTYTRIYSSRNSIEDKLIADIFYESIIFFTISIKDPPKFKEMSLKRIDEASHGRFKVCDIINVKDLIAAIEELYDTNYVRFLQAYDCISKNIDTLPEPANDKRVLEDILGYFKRPAFTVDFEYECSLEDFGNAIIETISYMNLGRIDPKTNRKLYCIEDLGTITLKKKFRRVVDGLNILRKLYLSMMDSKYACKVGMDKTRVIYTDCQIIFSRAMNDSRAVILHELKKIAKDNSIEFDIYPDYYEDSFYHSPIIKRTKNNLMLRLKALFEIYTNESYYNEIIESFKPKSN